jgi:Fe-S-cluster-containing hydrogenase component 2
VEACPVEALYRDEKTRAILINDDICVGCRLCIDKCPFGGISIDPDEERMIKCDLCGGDPQCAKYCPTEALKYVRADRMIMFKRRKGAEKMANLLEQVVITERG